MDQNRRWYAVSADVPPCSQGPGPAGRCRPGSRFSAAFSCTIHKNILTFRTISVHDPSCAFGAEFKQSCARGPKYETQQKSVRGRFPLTLGLRLDGGPCRKAGTFLRMASNPGGAAAEKGAQRSDAGRLRRIWSSSRIRLTPSRIWPIPAMPEIDASRPEERAIPRTCVIPRTASMTAVRFRPTW